MVCFRPLQCCFLLFASLLGSCANIVPPGGGEPDKTPPKLRSITPKDSLLNTRVSKIELQFDEYITLTDAAAQIQISPLLAVPITTASTPKRVTITLPDSLLERETTYRITFGNAIRDLHESNPFAGASYTFSTGAYFDSLAIAGTVTSAQTGLPDTAAFVLLFRGADGDSAIVKHRPAYVVHTDATGAFVISGLPPRAFRLYALRDANANLTYDGDKEWIAFADSIVQLPAASGTAFKLRTFSEELADSAAGSVVAQRGPGSDRMGRSGRLPTESFPSTGYRVSADTSNVQKRTGDIVKPLTISFAGKPSAPATASKIVLTSDSLGTTVEEAISLLPDSSGKALRIATAWKQNTVYTLRLQKGFAKDTAGADLLPGRFTFRTKRDEDYGIIRLHLPGKYVGPKAILQVSTEKDTVYQQRVTDSNVALLHLQPGIYIVRVILDANENGKWDAGNLFLRRQPEIVLPYNAPINLKAGWEQQIDFEAPRIRKSGLGSNADGR